MRYGRKRRILRRLALGFALVAAAAPTAEARYDGSASDEAVIVQGDDKILAPTSGALVQGDDKILAPTNGAALVQGDDKVFAPTNEVLVHGDDKVFAPTTSGLVHDDKVFEPTAGAEYSQWVYRRALPQDSGAPVQVVSVSRPDGFDWGDAGIGAGTLFGAIILATAAALAGRRLSGAATA